MIPAHLIRENKGSRMPRHFVYLDTEARIDTVGAVEHQSWRLGVTCYDGWDRHRGVPREPVWMRWADTESLWAYVSGLAEPRSRLIVCAHNLGYDLRISKALYLLPAEGWSLERFSLTARNVMVTWRRGDKASLVMMDSFTYLPMSLARIGKLVGVRKPDLPDQSSNEGWWERCEGDVQILRDAMRQIWAMIEDGNLGNWQRTGAGMAWANWRHRHYTHKVLVHQDQGAKDAETEATYTARCEAWRWGKFRGQPFTEWDYPLAYPRVALDTSLPVALVGHLDRVPDRCLSRATSAYRYLIRATVSTSAPTLPRRDETGFIWPVGTFTGWWWDHELGYALEQGATAVPLEAFMYRGKPALSAWARWVIEVAEGGGDEWTPCQRAAVKHWGRALIGRFAVRYAPWDYFGEGLDGAISAMTMHDHDTGQASTLLLLGDKSYIAGDKEYGSDSVPAINSAILSEARIRLYEAMYVAGLENVYYVDTDCLITDQGGSDNLTAYLSGHELYGLRPKRRHNTMKIWGPRAMTTDRGRKVAGVPTGAKRTSEANYAGESWESLPAALRRRRADEVVVTPADWQIAGVDHRREHLAGGHTAPRTVGDPLALFEAPQITQERLRAPRRVG